MKKSLAPRSFSEVGFTLMEILIVISILILIATVVLITLNPWAQIYKAWDSKRKTELAQLNKTFEDYYNDKGCYPKPADICYDSPVNICTGAGSHVLDSQTCHICGNESGSPLSLSSYVSTLPCDPQHKQKQYLYQVAAASEFLCPISVEDAANSCPQWYRVYSDLSNQSDLAIENLGCQAGGCGIAPNYGYEFGVTSPNEKLKKTTSYYCYNTSSRCNNCGATYEICEAKPSCITIYSSGENCCLRQPKPVGCP